MSYDGRAYESNRYSRWYYCPCGTNWQEHFSVVLTSDGVLYYDELKPVQRFPTLGAVPRSTTVGSTCPACGQPLPPARCPACAEPVTVEERNPNTWALDDYEGASATIYIRCPAGHEREVAERIEEWA